MRGADERTGAMFSYVSLEERVRADHPLRAVRRITDRALERLSPRFGTLYVNFGRPSDPAGAAAAGPAPDGPVLGPQRAAVVRADRYQPAVPLVPGPAPGDDAFDPTTFTHNRERLRTPTA